MEGKLLASYRMRKYSRAIEEFQVMRASIPAVSQWTLLVAAVSYAKTDNRQQAMALLSEIEEGPLSYEEEIFCLGVLLLLGQEKEAIRRESALPISSNCPIMRLQRKIVEMLFQ